MYIGISSEFTFFLTEIQKEALSSFCRLDRSFLLLFIQPLSLIFQLTILFQIDTKKILNFIIYKFFAQIYGLAGIGEFKIIDK